MQQPDTWDVVAPGFGDAAEHFRPYVEEALRLAGPSASGRLLDVAAGAGTLTLAAAPRAAHVTAVDFSPGMVAELRDRAARAAVGNLEAHVMNAQALTLPDASFDAAFCMFGFMFFPDRARAFAEILRVLRPGGRLVLSTWAPIERRPFMKVAFDALREVLPDSPAPFKGDLQHPGECVDEVAAAGFRDVESHPFMGSIRVESAEHYVDFLARSAPPIAALRKKLGDAGWGPVRQRMLDAVRPRVPSPIDLEAEAILTSATR